MDGPIWEEGWHLPQAVMSIIFLLLQKGKIPNNIQAIDAVLADLKFNKKIEIGEFHISRDASGYICEESVEFLELLGVPLSSFENIILGYSATDLCRKNFIGLCKYGDTKKTTAVLEALGTKSIENLINSLFK